MSSEIEIHPVDRPIRGTIRPPGSKSLTNRAFVVAALADGTTELTGVLDSRDTRVMVDSLRRLGLDVAHDPMEGTARVVGCGGKFPNANAELWLENSGTSIRFLTAACTLGHGTYRLDGNARMRERPILDLVTALRGLGAEIRCETESGCPPVVIKANGLPGGRVKVRGNISSQYLSALLMAAPRATSHVELELEGELVSEPYVEMTLRVMEQFGVKVAIERTESATVYHVPRQAYRGCAYDIEPDASAASYFFAAAAITGGEVTVPGLSRVALQGDVEFASVLEQMGCRVIWGRDSITVQGGPLRGVDVDMNAISDTAQTLSAVAVFAEGSTRIRSVAHMRHKETDRVSAVATELRLLGQIVEEHDDGLTITPSPVVPATVATYDDHRMAMSFALIGLRAKGIRIADPDCTSKTYPHYFIDLRRLCDES
ncbi:MAG: 3-phosphoshikimate 1-carboxyvinyltransferase [Planctomycetaceae bacterium]|nr:3-phosphoshikimate 1-carboxyvinyltransferase [Planctomycetaceae bacterium]